MTFPKTIGNSRKTNNLHGGDFNTESIVSIKLLNYGITRLLDAINGNDVDNFFKNITSIMNSYVIDDENNLSTETEQNFKDNVKKLKRLELEWMSVARINASNEVLMLLDFSKFILNKVKKYYDEY